MNTTDTTISLRALIVEDTLADAELMAYQLEEAGYRLEWTRVETEADYLAALDTAPDIILSDYNLPRFSGPRALELLKQRGLDIPFILVSGTVGEDIAVAAMVAGAHDYVLKDKLVRLAPAVQRELRACALRRDRRETHDRLEQQTRDLTERVKELTCLYTVSGLAQQPDLQLEELFDRIVESLVQAYQWPEQACARITHGNMVRQTDNFRLTPWQQEAPLIIDRKTTGSITVCYLQVAPDSADQPFLDEEQQMLNAVADRVSDSLADRRLRSALAESERIARATFNQAAVGIVRADLDRNIIDVNQKFCELTGYDHEELLHMTVLQISHPDDRGQDIALRIQLIAGEIDHFRSEKRYLRKDGGIIWVRRTTSLVRDTANEEPHYVIVVEDITDRKATEESYRATFDRAPVGIMHSSLDSRILHANPKLCEILGYTREELLTMSLADIIPSDYRGIEKARFLEPLLAGKIENFSSERPFLRKNGTIVWVNRHISLVRDAAGQPLYFLRTIEDITERKSAQEQLANLAHYDSLTGLPNRVLFNDRLRQAMALAQRNQWTLGVLFLDLDRFKLVNDTLGHTKGDLLLKQVAERLCKSLRPTDTVGRLSGDEFAIILSAINTPQNAGYVAKKIIDALAAPFDLDGSEVFMTASIGIALYPSDSENTDALLRDADAAMYGAKAAGRNNYQYYTAAMNERAQEKLGLETGLRRALERREFLLHYQPKIDIASGHISGLEALLRWQSPDHGLVLPGQFIPLLEETGMIVPVGEWVARAVCAQLQSWRKGGMTVVPVAINLSARQLRQQGYARMLEQAMKDFDVDPALIHIEITESSLMENPEEAIIVLQSLKALGIRLEADDFGTGYSSLGYLKRFPLDALKIDHTFVDGLPHDEDDAVIARTVITLAHSLGLSVIAEGVETEEQLAFLDDNRCDEAQGYLIARPMPVEDCTALLTGKQSLYRLHTTEPTQQLFPSC